MLNCFNSNKLYKQFLETSYSKRHPLLFPFANSLPLDVYFQEIKIKREFKKKDSFDLFHSSLPLSPAA